MRGLVLVGDSDLDLWGIPLDGTDLTGARLENVFFDLGHLKRVNLEDAKVTYKGSPGLRILQDPTGNGGCFFLDDSGTLLSLGWNRFHIWKLDDLTFHREVALPNDVSWIASFGTITSESLVYAAESDHLITWTSEGGFSRHSKACTRSNGYWQRIVSSTWKPWLALFTEGELLIWDRETATEITRIEKLAAFHAAFSRFKDHIWVGGRDGAVRRFDVHTGRLIQTISSDALGRPQFVYSLSIMPDDTTIAIGTTNDGIILWSIEEERQLHTIKSVTSSTTVITSPNGKYIAAYEQRNGHLKVVAVASGEVILSRQAYCASLTFSANSRYLVFTSFVEYAQSWVVDMDTMQIVRRLDYRVDLAGTNIQRLRAPIDYLRRLKERGATGWSSPQELSALTVEDLRILLFPDQPAKRMAKASLLERAGRELFRAKIER